MKHWQLSSGGLIMALIMSCGADAQRHAFTVADDIAMNRFSEPEPVPGAADTNVAPKSPDGKYVAIVTTKGILTTDRIISSIDLFDLHDAKEFLDSNGKGARPQPRLIATLNSFPHHQEPGRYAPVITNLRWSDDSKCLYFLGEDLNGIARLYQAKIGGSTAQVLTPAGYIVTQFAVTGDTIVYRAINLAMEQHRNLGDQINADARDVTGEGIHAILLPHEVDTFTSSTSAVWVIRKVSATQSRTLIPHSSFRDRTQFWSMYTSKNIELTPFSVSPSGRKLIELFPVTNVPAAWESYEPATTVEYLRYHTNDPLLASDTNIYRPKRYTLLDLDSGTVRPLVNAPNAITLGYREWTQVVWARSEQRVLVTNTFMPIDHVGTTKDSESLRPCVVASVDLPTGKVACVIANSGGVGPDSTGGVHGVTHLSFGKEENEVSFRVDVGQTQNQLQDYKYQNGEWREITSKQEDGTANQSTVRGVPGDNNIQLVVKQSLNDPPTLWVVNEQTGSGKQIWDPNPQFADIQFAQASVYRWKDKSGYEWTGGLLKPIGYVPGRRYPVVIQMYMFLPDEFLTDGTDPSAFAARELASAGFVVLQIQKKLIHSWNDAELQEHLEGYRSAIEHLDSDGLIDRSKAGVVGFSMTGWYVEDALIKAPDMFAAATISEGNDPSYMNAHFIDFANLSSQEEDYKTIGAKPFGKGLEKWFENAADFHLDQVRTPLRIEASGLGSGLAVLGEWELYSSLEMQNKPVDFIYFPTGTHIHQKPLERLESQQGDVDWFRFWLQGYEDPDPAKHGEYERWEHMRKLQDAEDEASENQIPSSTVH
jgi:dipeptidyl aminopeptidase/acylaminoacyl peptidase